MDRGRMAGPRRWGDLRWSTRLCLLGTVAVLVVLGGELAVRLYWRLAKGVPAHRTDLIWLSYFPEMTESGVLDVPQTSDDNTCDVLILGASVWHRHFSDLAPRLEAALARELGRSVRVHNIAFPGRTSLDSFERYRHLADKRFDLIVYYHGINDCFLNNCPRDVFRADYRHAPRYEQVALLRHHPEHGYFALPYSVRYLRSRWSEQLKLTRKPCREWNHHGVDLKSPPSFEGNLSRVLDLARQRGEPVLLMTFAYYIPADYSEEAFAQKRLDYDLHASPLITWGTPESVPQAIDAHNDVIRRLAQQYGTLFVDQRRLMPNGKRHYHDPCHLAPDGCEVFIDNIVKGIDWKSWAAK